MKRYRQFEPVMISDFEATTWQHPVHKHNHYEIIYIKKGKGQHHINQVRLSYKKGDVFFIGPEDEHYFEIKEQTHFLFIKFTDAFIHRQDYQDGIRQLEYIITRRDVHLSGFRFSKEDKATLGHLFNTVTSLRHNATHNESIIRMQVIALSTILQRSLPEITPQSIQTKDMQAVFCYIHKHIYTPGKLRATVMATHFNTTEDYIGPYFKRNTGLTLRDYIRDYRQTLIRKRIDSGAYSLKQIADEFGLTDESHVSKLLH